MGQKQTTQTRTPLNFMIQAIRDHPAKTAGMILGDTVQAVCVLLLPFVTKDLVNAVVEFNPTTSQASIWETAGTPFMYFVAVNILMLIAARASGTFLMFLAPIIRVLPRKRMTEQLQNHALNFFQTGQSGALGTKINTATVSLGHSLWVLIFDLWPVVIKFVVSCILMFLAHFWLGIVMLIWSLIYFAVMVYLSILRAYASEHISSERARITGSIVDMATNIQAVKSFANEQFENNKLDQEMADEIKGIWHFNVLREYGGWFHSIMTLFIMVTMMSLCLEYYASGHISVGEIAFVFTLILILTEQSAQLAYTISHFLELFGQMSDGVRTLFKPVALQNKADAAELDVSQGNISFDNVDFQYEEDIGQRVFEGFNLSIPSTQKLGLIGSSGAGKTTLVNLLLRFYDLQGGSILIDDQDIADVTQSSLRRNIAVIPQDTALFHRSLMENIRYGRLGASDEEVLDAANKAYAHEFIQNLPQGYNTLVGERGVKLSGGQRQRIAIARAILKDAPILILDEATSALDSESEHYIQESLKELMEGKTVIAIAHRLSTISHLDRLIVMESGLIVEDGTHHELLSNKGKYNKLWNMQSGNFLSM